MNNKQYFIDIVNKFIYGGEYIPPDDIDWNEIKHIAEIHSMLGIVGIVVNRSQIDIPLECYELFDYMVFEGARQGILLEMRFDEVTRALTNAEVPHIVVKGYVLRNIYPEKDMRSMSDIDFVIKKENMEKARDAMIEAGYKLNHIYRGEWSYKKDGMIIEFTHNLMDADVGFFDYEKYMSKIFDNTAVIKDYTYELTNEFHFIYMMMHTMKHFYGEGCGVRMILDLALFVKKYGESLDWGYVNKEFKRTKMDLFAKNMLSLCNRLFNVGDNIEMDEDLYNEIFNYILEGGAFGFARKNYAVAQNRDRIAKNESIAGTLFKRAFPNDKTLRGIVKWYNNKPKILLPVVWVYRWIHSAYIKKGSLFKSIILTCESEESKKQLELLKKIGLYRK